MAERGIYPAVDPLDSTSRIMDPNVIGAEHYGVARGVQKILQVYSGAVMHRQTDKVNRREMLCLRRWLFMWNHSLAVVTWSTWYFRSIVLHQRYCYRYTPTAFPPRLPAYSAGTQTEPDTKNCRACLR